MDETSFDVLVNIRSYSDDELRKLAEELQRQEREISRRRRIIHGQIDIVRAEIVRRLRDKHRAGTGLFDEGDIETLSAILSGRSVPKGTGTARNGAGGASDGSDPGA